MKLGQTDLANNVTVRIFGGTDMQLGGTDFGNKLTRELVRQTRWDRFALSVRPKSYKKETLNLHCNLGGTDSLFR